MHEYKFKTTPQLDKNKYIRTREESDSASRRSLRATSNIPEINSKKRKK